MPNNKRKIQQFKEKVRRKMRKLQQFMDNFDDSSSESDTEYSSDGPDHQPPSSDEGDIRSIAGSLNNPVTITANNDAQPQQNNNDAQPQQQEATSDPFEALFGLPSTSPQDEGAEIANDLAIRWESYLSSGLGKEDRKKLTEQWLAPTNCKYLKGPEVNPEVKVLLTTADFKKDKFQLNLQSLIGKAVTAQSTALAKVLEKKDSLDPLISQALVDSGKMLTDAMHTMSIHRRYQINKYLSEAVQKIAWQQKPDTFLFGADFSEKCKTAKALETAAQELAKRGEHQEPTSSHLNYQRPTYKTRLKNSSLLRGKEKKGGRTPAYSQNHKRQSTKTAREKREGHRKYPNKTSNRRF